MHYNIYNIIYIQSVSKTGVSDPLPEGVQSGQAWMLLFSTQTCNEDAPSVIPARAGSEEPAQKKESQNKSVKAVNM